MSLDYVLNKDGSLGLRWNPITGCVKNLDVCPIWEECWAKQRAEGRLRGRFGYDDKEPFKPTFHRDRLKRPIERKKPTAYYVGYMGDMFNREVPTKWIEKVLRIVRQTPRHRYLFLTKRAYKYSSAFLSLPTENAWYGASVNRGRDISRFTHLYRLGDRVKTYVEIEPAIHDISEQIYEAPEDYMPDWVIVGGWSKKDNVDLKSNIEYITFALEEKGVPVWHKDNLKYGWKKENPLWGTVTTHA